MQHNKDDFLKDDKKKLTKRPDQNKENDKDDNFGQDEAMAFSG